MSDWLDEALYHLPAEELPPELIPRLLVRLRRRRRLQRAGRAGASGLLLAGLLSGLGAAARGATGLAGVWPAWSWEDVLGYLWHAMASPQEAVLGSIGNLAGWMDRLGPQLEWTFLMGLVLLSLPAMEALRSLLEGSAWERSGG
jgi:hypothetical protein